MFITAVCVLFLIKYVIYCSQLNNLHDPHADDDFVESSIDLSRKIGQTVAVELIKVHFLRTCGTVYYCLVELLETAEQLCGVM